ncbi:MAG TPA: Maf family protein [Allosphingosinicella sp.]|nr:Maf family protein [Allosphingosinicella sp.]
MLEAAGVPFQVVVSDVDEDAAKREFRRRGLGAAPLAEALAEAKASAAQAGPGDLVLGSDQTLELEDGGMLDKPASREEAFAQLKALSGRTHRLHSAAAILEEGRPVWRHVESVVLTMRPLGADFLSAYLEQEYEAIRWSVGGYRIEGPGVQLFHRIEGSHFAILGLPLLPLLSYLRERRVIPG